MISLIKFNLNKFKDKLREREIELKREISLLEKGRDHFREEYLELK